MKHDPDVSGIDAEAVGRDLAVFGIGTTAAQCDLLVRHAEMVRVANRTVNLTRITDAEAMIRLHIVDSLAFLRWTQPRDGLTIDVGAGAGYPGIPLAVLGYEVELCESVKKKAAFLQTCVDELGIRATVAAMRAEELAEVRPRSAETVVFRAVSALPSLVELASPLLHRGGRLIALKGGLSAEEHAAGLVAAAQCGMVWLADQPYELSGGEKRTVTVFEKKGDPIVGLPRRPGMAQRHPLG